MSDYISRETAIRLIKYYAESVISTGQKSLDPVDDIIVMSRMIATLTPSADVEPVVHGRWERCFEDWRQQIDGDKCSLCGFEYYGTGISRFLHCPNCGAKMDLAPPEGDSHG